MMDSDYYLNLNRDPLKDGQALDKQQRYHSPCLGNIYQTHSLSPLIGLSKGAKLVQISTVSGGGDWHSTT